MDKTVVKEHIVLAAAKSFAQKGVKTVRMDDIAAGLSISKVSIRPRACFSPSYNKVKSQTKHVWLLTLL